MTALMGVLLLVTALLEWPVAQQPPTPLQPCEIMASAALVRVEDASLRPLGALLQGHRPRLSPRKPAWLLDGRHVVFASVQGASGSVYVTDTTRVSHARLITDDFYQYSRLSLSPDGAWVATVTDFSLSARTFSNEIVLHHLDSGEQIVLDPWEGNIVYSDPQWSPDGVQLVFRIDYGISQVQKWRMNVDGTGLTLLADENAYPVAWSPDGAQIAVGLVAGGLYLVEADGRRRLLVDGLFRDLAWSPDGTQIAAARSTGPGLIRPWYQLVVVDVATGQVTALTEGDAFNGQPAWSPTGRQIAFVSDRVDPAFGANLWLMNADGSDQRPLTERAGISWAHAPAWNPVTCANE